MLAHGIRSLVKRDRPLGLVRGRSLDARSRECPVSPVSLVLVAAAAPSPPPAANNMNEAAYSTVKRVQQSGAEIDIDIDGSCSLAPSPPVSLLRT